MKRSWSDEAGTRLSMGCLSPGALALSVLALSACGGGDLGEDPGPADAQAPTVSLGALPAARSHDHYLRVEFSSNGATEYQCSLDNEPYAGCASPWVATPIGIGPHQLRVRARAAGGAWGEAAQHRWEIASLFEDPSRPPPGLVYEGTLPPSNGHDFRIKCEVSHFNYDDPIVYPGRPGAAHLHMYMGNLLTDAHSTIAGMVSLGDTSCQGSSTGHVLNRSSYWVPALLAPRYRADGAPLLDAEGQQAHGVVHPDTGWESTNVYYKAAIDRVEEIQPMPHGLRMISGLGSATPDRPQPGGTHRWICESVAHSPDVDWGVDPKPYIPRCKIGDRLELSISFPFCWDGWQLYHPQQAHMSGHVVTQLADGSWLHHCPSTHPVALPVVSYNFLFPVTAENASPEGDTRRWRLSSDSYTVSDEVPGGHSAHGDWFMAWHPEVMEAFVRHCINGRRNCSTGELGNGWRLTTDFFRFQRPGYSAPLPAVTSGPRAGAPGGQVHAH